MTDVDYCSGGTCILKSTCERFRVFLKRKESNKPTDYAMTPKDNCEMYRQIGYYGN